MTPPVNAQPGNDERWLLTQRVLASAPFQKAERLKALLIYLIEESSAGRGDQLTEQRIGQEVFGKPAGYSPAEDSSVRANIRLLRLRLLEYFNGAGRQESLVLELPKGSYCPVFRPQHAASSAPEPAPPAQSPIAGRGRLVLLLAAVALLSALAGFWLGRAPAAGGAALIPPWPLSEVYDPAGRTQLLLPDTNHGFVRILAKRAISLDEYLSPNYPASLFPSAAPGSLEARLLRHLTRNNFVSYPNTLLANRLLLAMGGSTDRLWVRSARDLKMRDLDDGNMIFVGSPASNPWVSMFDERLNFNAVKEFDRPASFLNRQPAPGEQPAYSGMQGSGDSGSTYASVALFPAKSGRGRVLILQGLQQEGTEAAGLLVATADGRRLLRQALGLPADSAPHGVFFEVLIRSHAAGGSPVVPEIVATRRLRQAAADR